jgi:hypothetical protein
MLAIYGFNHGFSHPGTMLMKKQQEVRSNCHCIAGDGDSNDNDDAPISYVDNTYDVDSNNV